jgi:hypothetical protein
MRNLSALHRCFLNAWWEQEHYILSEDVFSLLGLQHRFLRSRSSICSLPSGFSFSPRTVCVATRSIWPPLSVGYLTTLSISKTRGWSSTWGTRTPGETRRHLRGMRKRLTSTKTKHRNHLNLEPTLILALTMIRPRIEVLECQKQAQLSH